MSGYFLTKIFVGLKRQLSKPANSYQDGLLVRLLPAIFVYRWIIESWRELIVWRYMVRSCVHWTDSWSTPVIVEIVACQNTNLTHNLARENIFSISRIGFSGTPDMWALLRQKGFHSGKLPKRCKADRVSTTKEAIAKEVLLAVNGVPTHFFKCNN